MKLLIVGSSGYIGSNLIDYIKWNCPHIDFVKCDIVEGTDYKDVELSDIEYCVFLAAIPGIQDCNTHPDKTIEQNILEPIRFFERCIESNVHIIFSSSIAARNPASSLYAFSKRTLEKWLLNNASKQWRTILRFSNVYGGEYFENKSSVVASFIKSWAKDKVLHINGNGSQKRDFIHVEDICSYIIESIDKRTAIYNTSEEITELGSGEQLSILDVAKLIQKYYKCEIEYSPDGFVGVKEVDPIDVTELRKTSVKWISMKEYVRSLHFDCSLAKFCALYK